MKIAMEEFTREHFERLEEERLAVYASKSARAKRAVRAVGSTWFTPAT